jgi:hypothetical protein
VTDASIDASNVDVAKVTVPPPGRVIDSDFARLSTFMADGFANGFTSKYKSQAIPMLQASARGESNLGDVVAWAHNASEASAISRNISTIAKDFVAGFKDLVLRS